MPEVIERPEEAFGGVAVDFERLLVRPLFIPKPHEDEILAVGADAEHAGHGAVFFAPHGIEPAADLLDELLVVGGVADGGERPWVLVFDDDVAIDRIGPACGYRHVVVGVQGDLGLPRKLLQGARHFDL